MNRFVFGLAAAVAAGCAGDTPFGVAAGFGALRLANSTNVAVYYVVMESEFAARADWTPCTNPSTCPQVAPYREKRVAYEEIAGYDPGDSEAILYWWHLEPGGPDGFQPDSIRAIRLFLRPGA